MSDFLWKEKLRCTHCKETLPHIWSCMIGECQFIGCGRNQNKHCKEHCDSEKHNVCINIHTLAIWCYDCDSGYDFEYDDNKKNSKIAGPFIQLLQTKKRETIKKPTALK
eukprot:TRINITY_DN13065_c0_g1_i1.p1 TRINITY_DN13065_c0_g1~~TRINITY_DN13065_c0_g1_i1.p1  ORF type:complete len:109 (-),score=17.03 TRINITY_DN13065_c0_g1_i1:8-334(-)